MGKWHFTHSRLFTYCNLKSFFFLLPSIKDYCRLTIWMHMLVENETSPWGQSWERVFHKHKCIPFIARVPKAQVLWTVCTSACGKFFPKIIPMAKFHSLIACGYVLSPYNNPLLKAKGRKKLIKLQCVIIYYGEMTFSP